MSQTPHAPTPWKLGKGAETKVYSADNRFIADCNTINMMSCGDEKANARLIAAAPELLQFAEQFMESKLSAFDTIELGQKARAAIAKARGE